jgi:hypothetical protein
LQVVSLAAVFPVRWPAEIERFFAFQSAISSVSQTLLSPDCELSHMTPADAFYQKQIGFAFLPIVIVVVCNFVWCIGRNTKQRCRTNHSTKAYYNDRAVLSWVTLLYLAYPTSVTQGLSMMGCEKIGGVLWLAADLQEPCYIGRHLTNWWLICLPQILMFVLGLPLGAAVVLWRNRHNLHSPRTQFRWGILYAGYRDKLYWWEITIVIRKLVMVLVGGVFASRLGPDMQIYLSLALVVVFVVGHLVAQPFNELTIHHKMLHWLELGALLACFATLYSGMLFYIGHETGRLPDWTLNLASGVIIGGNSGFMIYSIFAFVGAMRRESKEAKGMTAAERRLFLRKMSQEKSKATKRQKEKSNKSNKSVKVEELLEKNIVLSKVVIKPKIKRKSKLMTNGISLQAMANLAIHHDKGVRNFESHEITKKVQQTKLKRRQSHSRVRLNARIRQAKAKAAAISKLPKVKKIDEKILMEEEKNTISTNVIVPLVVSEIKDKEMVEKEEKTMGTEVEVPLNQQEEQQQLQLQEEQQPQQQQQQQQPREIGKGWWQMYDANSGHYYYECVGKQTTWEWPQEVPKEIELKKLPLPLPPPTTLKIITEKQPLLLSTFDSLCIKIYNKLHSMNKANLFLKLDRNNIGLIHRDHFSALIKKVDKTLTTKETLAESWKLATKGDVGKLGLDQKEMEEWIVKCGQR